MDRVRDHDFKNDLQLRVVFMEQYPINFAAQGGEVELTDFWIWFASVKGWDSWFAFSLSADPDNIEGATENSIIEELKIMSVWMGYPWSVIEGQCEHCVALQQRDRFHSLPEQTRQDLRSKSLERLRQLRQIAEFGEASQTYEASTGGKLSLN